MNKVGSNESLTTVQIPKETTVFDQLRQDPEVVLARNHVKGILFYKQANGLYPSLAELRHIYQKKRDNERLDITSSKLSLIEMVDFIGQKSYENISKFFAVNTWIIGLILMIIDVLFILLYLAEMEENVGYPCNIRSVELPNPCGNLKLPTYLLVKRGSATFHILVTLDLKF
jgi:hypothetical protein